MMQDRFGEFFFNSLYVMTSINNKKDSISNLDKLVENAFCTILKEEKDKAMFLRVMEDLLTQLCLEEEGKASINLNIDELIDVARKEATKIKTSKLWLENDYYFNQLIKKNNNKGAR